MATKKVTPVPTPAHTFRHRLNAAPAPRQVLRGLSKTEPDKGISIKELLDRYQKPNVEPKHEYFNPDIVIPVFPRAMDFAQVQAYSEAVELQRQRLRDEIFEQKREQAKQAAAKIAENAASASAPALEQKASEK